MSRYYTGAKDGDVEFVCTAYGKNAVKVLHIKRDGKRHAIKEVEASVQLTLKSKKDYLHGDNSDIIPTDTMKNTVYALAKLKGIQTIEGFAMDICEHFLSSFNHVTKVRILITEAPWKGLEKNGRGHIHAFIYTPDGIRFCEVEQNRGEPPVIRSGIKDLKVLKTTQSGFEGFIKDRFTTLPEVKDRCFSTVVNCKWTYSHSQGINFDAAWKTVWESVLEKFAGPSDTGEYSPSVQKTLYDIQVLCLKRIPEIESIEIVLPNKHYFTIDMSKFGLDNKDEVLLPLDIPFGNIMGTVRRKPAAKL
ncbi:uricase-like isoform X2 [Rhinatrema bivittatum]|uniref:uricase-like isoform X2 n=1 Tax=Rhinatrema bivittatum TaxID=194408 RepID=UPI00112A78E4|nr:uricase-like isoform X2 [Rhinatrema bivittatum]